MAEPKYFRVPRASLITLPRGFALSATGDVFIAFEDTRAWGYVDQARGRVVVMDLMPATKFGGDIEYRTLVAYDGPWADQLLEWSADDPTFGPVYDYEKRSNILNIPNTYTEVARLRRFNRPAGTYELSFSVTWQYDQANQQSFWRWSLDGGTLWNELIFDVGSSNQRMPVFYGFPYIFSGGQIDVWLQARKSATAGTFDVFFADIVFEKKTD